MKLNEEEDKNIPHFDIKNREKIGSNRS